jgi:hypothetical protein
VRIPPCLVGFASWGARRPGDPEAGVRRTQADGHRTEVRELYADLISRVREELRQDREPRWRRLGAGRPGS